MTTLPLQRVRRPNLAELLSNGAAEVIDIRAGSRPMTHRLTVADRATRRELFCAVAGSCEEGVPAVEEEGRLLVELRRGDYGPAVRVAPRHVGVAEHAGRPVLLTTPLPGRRLSARTRPGSRDVAGVFEWLAGLRAGLRLDPVPVDLGREAVETLMSQSISDPVVSRVLEPVARSWDRLDGLRVPPAVTHGSLSMEKITVEGGRVVGVEDWGCATLAGDPVRDLAGFAVACAGLDLGTLLNGRNAVPSTLRRGVRAGLRSVGVDPRLYADVLVLALAEWAADPSLLRRHAGLAALLSCTPDIKE
jgi:hypothetical protein